MKILSLLSALTLGITLLAAPVRADDAAAVKRIPEVQALLDDLLKARQSLSTLSTEETATAVPSAAPVPPAAPVTAQKVQPAPMSTALRTGTLTTGSLTTGGLMPSAPLGGHGLTGGTPRLSAADWRQLFPARNSR